MMTSERRLSPRIALKNLAYVNLEPDNGGILIDISEGGICIRSAVPIQPSSMIRFWFSLDNHRIEASGRLTWTDSARRRGGLRFTHLSTTARKEISDWISQHSLPATVNDQHAPSPPSPTLIAGQRSTLAALQNSAMLAAQASVAHSPRSYASFSGGLVSGILISTLVAALFLLQTHRRELGQSLVHLGERLGGGSVPQPAAPGPPATLPESQPATSEPQPLPIEPQTASLRHPTSSESLSPSPSLIAVSQKEKLLSAPSASTPQSNEIKPDPDPVHVTTAPAQLSTFARPNPAIASSSSFSPPLVPSVPGTLALELSVASLRPTIPQLISVESSKALGTASPSEKFLEVGRFNDKLWADKTTDKLSQFGFPVRVVPRNHFWKKSYQVLVGPYATDQEAQVVHNNLSSHGFSPRSFERGSRDFRLPRPFRIGNASMPVGDCIVSWESYIPDAIVRFQVTGAIGAVAEATWVDRRVKYGEDAVVYTTNRDGSRNLIELRFAGMGRALVFAKGAS